MAKYLFEEHTLELMLYMKGVHGIRYFLNHNAENGYIS